MEWRRRLGSTVATAVLVGLTTACGGSAHPHGHEHEHEHDDPAAAAAARAYSRSLTTWSAELGRARRTAAAKAPASTKQYWSPLGKVLAHAPVLKRRDSSDAAYLRAVSAAGLVDAAVTERKAYDVAVSPTSPQQSLYHAQTNLYIHSPYLPVLNAYSRLHTAVTNAQIDAVKTGSTAGITRTLARLAIRYLKANVGTMRDQDKTIDKFAAKGVLGDSLAAFSHAWVEEQVVFDKAAITDLGRWSTLTGPYNDLLGGDTNFYQAWMAPAVFSRTIGTGYVRQIKRVAEWLSGDQDQDALPGQADPYRTALLTSYHEPAPLKKIDEYPTYERLWLLWRIRELEKTPTATYDEARSWFLHELAEQRDKDEVLEFRDGNTRLLVFTQELDDAVHDGYDDPHLSKRLKEIVEFGRRMAALPGSARMTTALTRIVELVARNAPAFEKDRRQDDFDGYARLSGRTRKQLLSIANGPVGLLDHPKRVAVARTAAIKATAPTS